MGSGAEIFGLCSETAGDVTEDIAAVFARADTERAENAEACFEESTTQLAAADNSENSEAQEYA